MSQKRSFERLARLNRRRTNEFHPDRLLTTVIAIPLLRKIAQDDPRQIHEVIIDLNLDCKGGREAAKKKVKRLINDHLRDQAPAGTGWSLAKDVFSAQYVFARLTGWQIRELIRLDQTIPFEEGETNDPIVRISDEEVRPTRRQLHVKEDCRDARDGEERHDREDCAIYHIWPDFQVRALISRSVATVKADAAHKSFSAFGRDIVWAVMDSGIDGTHPHFQKHGNLALALPVKHRDFTVLGGGQEQPLQDRRGHGTHVAGIIAGEIAADPGQALCTLYEQFGEDGQKTRKMEFLPAISGMAPQCKIVSLKVLNDQGSGPVSNLIAAITYIQEINGYGRRLLIHGVNMSVGYDFDPEWFACGQSPLCVEVNRLVRSGVVVVVAAGNTGYVFQTTAARGRVAAGANLTINDPGNAEQAITVGATHRDMPHVYGVSYFSSKGPTGDGRLKPDLLAPGEKILSCASAQSNKQPAPGSPFDTEAHAKASVVAWYVADSGTSMAAPHVSGVVAAFLSIRREFIGQPDEVKRIFVQSATDLGRERYFQGNGLVDLMRAIQSI